MMYENQLKCLTCGIKVNAPAPCSESHVLHTDSQTQVIFDMPLRLLKIVSHHECYNR